MSNDKQNNEKSTLETMEGGETASQIKAQKVEHSEAIQAKPLEVKVYGSTYSAFEKASRAFRAMVQKSRILSDFKESQRYEKPSDKKRRKRNESKRKEFEQKMLDKKFNSSYINKE